MRVIRRFAAMLRELPLSVTLGVVLVIILTGAIVSARLGDDGKDSSSASPRGESFGGQTDSTLGEASSQEGSVSAKEAGKEGRRAALAGLPLTSSRAGAPRLGSSPAPEGGSAKSPAPLASPSPSPTSPQFASGCGTSTFELVVGGRGSGGPCSYTATKPGGYVGQGIWSITIKRGDSTIEVDHINDPYCSQTGFIHPGDEVTARVGSQGANSISVGDDAHC